MPCSSFLTDSLPLQPSVLRVSSILVTSAAGTFSSSASLARAKPVAPTARASASPTTFIMQILRKPQSTGEQRAGKQKIAVVIATGALEVDRDEQDSSGNLYGRRCQ